MQTIDKEHITGLLSHPHRLDHAAGEYLSGIIREYPYFQLAWLLLARQKYNVRDPDADNFLKKAAIYAGDRKKLFGLITGEAAEDAETVKAVPVTAPEIPAGGAPTQKKQQKLTGPLKPASKVKTADAAKLPARAVTEKKTVAAGDIHTFTEWLNLLKEQGIADDADRARKKKGRTPDKRTGRPHANATPRSKKGIALPHDPEELKALQYFSELAGRREASSVPSEQAVAQSLSEENEPVSETLARIHTAQGNTLRAIEMYEKLILLYPGKSAYFAGRIKNLKK